jgi:hypothetical protein
MKDIFSAFIKVIQCNQRWLSASVAGGAFSSFSSFCLLLLVLLLLLLSLFLSLFLSLVRRRKVLIPFFFSSARFVSFFLFLSVRFFFFSNHHFTFNIFIPSFLFFLSFVSTTVSVYKLVSNDTIEDKVVTLANQKKLLHDVVLEEGAFAEKKQEAKLYRIMFNDSS